MITPTTQWLNTPDYAPAQRLHTLASVVQQYQNGKITRDQVEKWIDVLAINPLFHGCIFAEGKQ